METYKILENILASSKPAICLLAPSFTVDFTYPDIIYMLRAMGFEEVVELTYGAKMVNTNYLKLIKSLPDRTWISSPCPTLVTLIRNSYPHLIRNLVPIHSPMGATSLICEKLYPEYSQVFVGPCVTKKSEALEIGSILQAITFKELLQYMNTHPVTVQTKHQKSFTKFYNDYTKIYPLSGGLSQTLHYKGAVHEKQILVQDGTVNLIKIFDSFKNGFYEDYLFLDLLSCNGGCIGGPGIISTESLKSRKNTVISYKTFAKNHERDLGRRGYVKYAENIEFGRTF